MFEIPNAKRYAGHEGLRMEPPMAGNCTVMNGQLTGRNRRVRRDEVFGSSSDGSDSDEHRTDDAEERAKLDARLSSLLGLDLDLSALPPDPAPGQGPGAEHHEGDHDQEFEFRLFSGPARASAPAKVVLDVSDDDEAREGGGAFVTPARPQSYYLAGEASPEQRQRYAYAAVTAEDIAAGARNRAWGLERPWRVVRVTPSSSKPPSSKACSGHGATASSEESAEARPRRKRPGKKRRIAARTKARAEKTRREAEDKQRISKEEHLLEKKKRLNREKKLKRRAKEKEKKSAAGEKLPPSERPDSAGSE
jgi:hypothetical protein